MTIAVLREHRKRSLEERILVGPDFEDRGLVFHPSRRLMPQAQRRQPPSSGGHVRPTCRHTLKGRRHTRATVALERGIHLRVVQERLGHSTIVITLGIYSHVAPTLHDEALKMIGESVLGG